MAIQRNFPADLFDSDHSNFYTLDAGEILTPEWTIQEVVKRLGRQDVLKLMPLEIRRSVARTVVESRRYRSQTVGSVTRGAYGHWLLHLCLNPDCYNLVEVPGRYCEQALCSTPEDNKEPIRYPRSGERR